MLPRYRRSCLTGFGIAATLFAAGAILAWRAHGTGLATAGLIIALVGFGFYLQGCLALAKARGYSRVLVLTFVLGGFFPLLLLLALPDRNRHRRWTTGPP
jgi:hypothetical protein